MAYDLDTQIYKKVKLNLALGSWDSCKDADQDPFGRGKHTFSHTTCICSPIIVLHVLSMGSIFFAAVETAICVWINKVEESDPVLILTVISLGWAL